MSVEFKDVLAALQVLATEAGISLIGFDPASSLQPWSEGQFQYDPVSGGHIGDTKYTNVSLNIGRELHFEVYNNTGIEITNGYPVSVDGTLTGETPNVVPLDPNSILSILGFAGVATMNIPDGEKGLITPYGEVKGVNTMTLSTGFIYAHTDGFYTQERPKFPTNRLIIGGVVKAGAVDGIINVNPQLLSRRNASRSYHFTSSDALAGRHYSAGFYDWNTTSVSLNQGSTSVTYGAADLSRAAHAGILVDAAGIVDTGQVLSLIHI